MTDSTIPTPIKPDDSDLQSTNETDTDKIEFLGQLTDNIKFLEQQIEKLTSKADKSRKDITNLEREFKKQEKVHGKFIYSFVIVVMLAILAIVVAIGLDYCQIIDHRQEDIIGNQKNIQSLQQNLNKNTKILNKDHDYIEQVIGHNQHQYRNNPRSTKNK